MATNPLLIRAGLSVTPEGSQAGGPAGPGTWRPGQVVGQVPSPPSAAGPGTWRPGQTVAQPPMARTGNPMLRTSLARPAIEIPTAPRGEPTPDVVKYDAPPYPRSVLSAYPSRPIGGYDFTQSYFWNTGTIVAGEIGLPLVMKFLFGPFPGYTWVPTGMRLQTVDPTWSWAGIVLHFQSQRNGVPIAGDDGWQWYGMPDTLGEMGMFLVFDAPDVFTEQVSFFPTAAQLGQAQTFNMVMRGNLIPTSGFPFRNDVAHAAPIDVTPQRKLQ